MQKIDPLVCIPMSEHLIDALKDMEDYELFCQFYLNYIMCHPQKQARSVSGTTMLKLYFITKNLFES